MQREAFKAIREKEHDFIALATRIWETPETAYNEVNACEWTAALAEELGFTVERGLYGHADSLACDMGQRTSSDRLSGRI